MSSEVKEEIKVSQSRFRDAPWFGVNKTILLGGQGGIGSWCSLFLARIGHNLILFDNDNIEEVNMAGQLYSRNLIGRNKAEAMSEIIHDFSDCDSVQCRDRYTNEYSSIMFSCFDNMAARKAMFEAWKQEDDREIFIDGRLLAEVGIVYIVTKGKEDEYEATLFEDSEIADAPCSFKSTSHSSALIASLMVSALNNYIANQNMKMDIREIPFKVSYELAPFNFEIKC